MKRQTHDNKPCRCRRFVTHAALLADVRRIRQQGNNPYVWPFFAMASCHHIVEDTSLVHKTIDVSHLGINTNGEVFTFVSLALKKTCNDLQEIIEMMEKAGLSETAFSLTLSDIKRENAVMMRACEMAEGAEGVSDEFRQTANVAALQIDAAIEKMKLKQTILFFRNGKPPFAIVRCALLIALGGQD